ncbi:MAG: tetratricopeptide repeat protein [Candidatus Wildermuthbacteria bacterium]|nr:tetratricopeptide repeat protein [Candidatus Wildermuthbacteria bacterium]
MKSITFFNTVSKWSLYLLVFLVPLWFLPFTQDALNFQKQVLLAVLVFLALIAFLARTVNAGELGIRMTWLHVPVLLVVLVMGVSTLFSQWKYGSFWGWPLDVTDNFLTVFLFALVYFLVSFALENSSQLFRLALVLLVSAGAAAAFALLQLYGVFVLPFLAFAKSATFNTVGTTNSIAVLSAVLLPLTLIMSSSAKKVLRIALWVVAAVLLAAVVLINFFDAWVVLLAGLLVMVAFGAWSLKNRGEFSWVSLPMALLVLSLFFLVFRVSLPGTPGAPIEVSPSLQGEFNILQGALKENPVTGSGPGTFVFDYTKYHSPTLNQTIFWGTRFSSGASELLDWTITKGILGALALLSLFGAFLYFGVKNLAKGQGGTSGMLGLGIFASLAALIVAFVLYPSNFTLWFVFWVLLGGFALTLAGEQKRVSLAPPSFLAVVSSFLFLLVLIFGLGLVFVGGQKYIAEAKYVAAVRLVNQGNLEEGLNLLVSAVRLNPSVDIYWRDLSQLYLNQVNQISQDQNLKQEERAQQVQAAITNVVNAAQQATRINPANIANWNVQGFVYRNLLAVPGADQVVFASYEKAIELDPTSPFSWTELARAYIVQAQTLQNQKDAAEKRAEALNKGLENLAKAIELKQDYAPAHFLTAVILQEQGKTKEAIAKLVETKTVAPNDLGVAFQLGVMYWQDNQLENARKEFEAILAKEPNHANAQYMLGLVLDKLGKKTEAKAAFQKLADLNPNNEDLKKILENLNKNRPALEGVTPSQPPVEETPPEIGS